MSMGGFDEAVAQASTARRSGNLIEAMAGYRSAADLADSDDRRSFALRHLSDCARETGRQEEALVAGSDAVRLSVDARPLDRANALRVYALAQELCGDEGGAKPAWRAARACYVAADVDAGVQECDAHLNPSSA